MSVNHEVKGHLARLLATEDLVVEHKHVPTASFNVDTRVLILPMWEKASNVVYDMLVGHEVGHALYTPNEDWSEKFSIPQQFVNVTEDARIEKLMKRRYAGLNKCFYAGYRELHEDDFFQVKEEDISKFNLADRANLYFKIGNYIDIQFNQEEQEIITMIGDAETFDEAIQAAVKLYEYCKKEQDQQMKIDSIDTVEQNSGNSSEPSSEPQEEYSDQNTLETSGEGGQTPSDGESGDDIDQPSKGTSNQGGETSDPKVHTADNLEESIRDLVNSSSYENVYVELPKLNLETVIASNSEVHDEINDWWNKSVESLSKSQSNAKEFLFGKIDKDFREFKRSAQKEVNYLVKEFECRKAADSYARSTTARTGVLDCSKLHTYKYNEDLFRKVTTLANGKNHGLVFVLDWSGSMSNVMQDTIKQLYNLIWFCKKVSIPFEVYAFTNEWRRSTYDEKGNFMRMEPHYQKKSGLICVDETFSMMNKLQKVQCVVLTDGEACYMKFHKEFKNRSVDGGEPYIGLNSLNSHPTFIRDRKTGCTYKVPFEFHQFTDTLLQNLRDRFPSVNFIGMRVLENREANSFIRKYYDNYEYSSGYAQDNKEYVKIMNDWKKNKSFSIKNSGYHSYFGLSGSALSQDSEFDVHECATKSQIKSAFAKSLKSKKMNKKILGEFIDLVA